MSNHIPTHPGEILKDEIEARGLTANRFAIEIGVPVTRIGEILHRRRAVTPETALRLAAYFGGSPKVWLSLQADYDLAEAERKHGREIKRTVSVPVEAEPARPTPSNPPTAP
ncbi:MAG: HigA family addiction module antitoxin [Proteobacteria bacterium]|nr:HigA family addiction module antitoxin [Pseudomonadota bacterium]